MSHIAHLLRINNPNISFNLSHMDIQGSHNRHKDRIALIHKTLRHNNRIYLILNMPRFRLQHRRKVASIQEIVASTNLGTPLLLA